MGSQGCPLTFSAVIFNRLGQVYNQPQFIHRVPAEEVLCVVVDHMEPIHKAKHMWVQLSL